jgi:hypothetical protein
MRASLIAFVLLAASAPSVEAADSLASSAVRLEGGSVFTKTGKLLVTASPAPVSAVTISENGRFVVFVRQRKSSAAGADEQASMWILDRKNGRRIRAGAALGHPCCEFATDAADASRVFGKFEPVNGALWSRSQRVLVRFAGQVHILSMDGSLRGDV